MKTTVINGKKYKVKKPVKELIETLFDDLGSQCYDIEDYREIIAEKTKSEKALREENAMLAQSIHILLQLAAALTEALEEYEIAGANAEEKPLAS